MSMVEWNTIDGVPVHYARDLVPSLRNPGTQRTFRSTADFKATLDAAFNELWAHCGLGKADIIVTAGAFVDKEGKHGAGRAFDLDGIVWRATDARPPREWYSVDFAADQPFYWGVGGILNRHLRFVLHAKYDADHADHFHVDNSESPRFASGSRSAVTYLQAAITHVHGIPIVIDGKAGPQTMGAVGTVLDRLAIAGSLDDPAVWKAFNLATARIGMGANAAAPPLGGDGEDMSEPVREDVAPTGNHELGPDNETSPSFRLRLTTPRTRGDKVKELQRALKDAGHDPGRVDGIFGSKTEAAVRSFQRSNGLEVDGIVGPNTAAALAGFSLGTAAPAPARVLGPMRDWGDVPAKTRRARAMQILVERYGYPVNGAAGIVGNLVAESGVIPNRVEGSLEKSPMTSKNSQGAMTTWTADQVMNRVGGQTGPRRPGAGLAQWTFPSRREGLFTHRFEDETLGAAILFDMDAQVDYLVEELRSPEFRKEVDDVVSAANVTLERASDVFLMKFERPEKAEQQKPKRREFSVRARDDFLAASG